MNVQTQPPGPLAFVLGTRKNDPNCGAQEFFSPSSSWMPPFMRVNPILTWSYGQVWRFLRHFDLNYCSLYDQGYTSLGKQTDTFPNPSLRESSSAADGSSASYLPAYMLTDWTLERAGRVSKGSASASASRQASVAEGCEISPPKH